MQFSPPVVQLAGIAPEIALVVAAFVLLIADAVMGSRLPTIAQPVLASVGLIVAAYLASAAVGRDRPPARRDDRTRRLRHLLQDHPGDVWLAHGVVGPRLSRT